MSLDGALSIAGGGLANINAAMAVLSQNISNASTPQYAVETSTQQSVNAGGQVCGVSTGVTIAASDPGLQNQVAAQSSDVAAWQTTNNALSSLQAVMGTVGGDNDLGSQLTALQGSFSTLLGTPSDTTNQSAVITAAATLARGINTIAQAYLQASQTAQNSLVSNVAQLNTALAQIGSLNSEIIQLQSQGTSVADLQNQMSQVENTISGLVSVSFSTAANGSVSVLTAGGAQLPTIPGSPTLSIANTTIAPGLTYPDGGLPGIMLGDTDITSQLTGGTIGANLALRNQTLPTYQAALDEFSETLSNRFAAQGLTLFTAADGTIPQATGTGQTGYVGYANAIQVNPSVTQTPSLVRDGTNSVAGSPTGAAAFSPNTSQDAGFTTLISNILNYTFGADAQSGVPQANIASTGLGANGDLSTGFGAQTTLGDYANAITAGQAAQSANATTQTSDATALQTSLQTKLTGATGVDLDTELGQMVTLQNAYGANAKVISAIETMYTYLMNIAPTS